MNFAKIPYCWPFKMIPVSATPNTTSDFDGAWAAEQIKSFETKAYYKQKWVKTDTTVLQIENSIAPEDLKVYDITGKIIKKSFAWVAKFIASDYTIWETVFDISDLPDGVYFIYQRTFFDNEIDPIIDWAAISEPIYSKSAWPGTLKFNYFNSFNDFDIAWTTGCKMTFRCEAGIMDADFIRGATDYVDQLVDRILLSAYPSRQFKLYIGDARGVAPWVIDILNRIFACDNVTIDDVAFTASADKWEVNRVKGYPLVGASIDIVPSTNKRSIEFASGTELAKGIVVAYQIQTTFFGKTGAVNVLEVETD